MKTQITLFALFALLSFQSYSEPIRLMLLWEPQSQFAGYYMAKEKGIYEEYGLDLELIHSGTDKNPLEWLFEGKTDYCLSWLNACLASERVNELIHVGQVFNQSNLMLVAWKDHGIERLEDLDQKKVSIWGGMFRYNFENLFTETGIRPDIVDLYYTVNLFLRKGVSASSVMQYNEYDTILLSGVESSELARFFMRDLGFNLPEDGIYTLRDRWMQKPNEARKLLEATLEGWEYARQNPEETLDYIMTLAEQENLPTNRVHMQWMLDIVLKAVFSETGEWKPGVLSKAQYDRTVELMKHNHLLDQAPAFEAFTCSGE